MEFETIIGLEVHAELATDTKIYCSCANEFGGDTNTHCCPICTGMPVNLSKNNATPTRKSIGAKIKSFFIVFLQSN